MSVKLMTLDQLRADLENLTLIYPEGIPWQQVDRVNALKGEIKRRNEPIERPAGSKSAVFKPIPAIPTPELEAELRELSTRTDDDSQERFANVRFELRRRAKLLEDLAQEEDKKVKRTPAVTPRELELPSDEEVERVVPRRQPAAPPAKTSRPTPSVPDSVRGYRATSRGDRTVVLEYEIMQKDGSVLISQVFTPSEVEILVDILNAAKRAALAWE
jgi:hypothetical protein